MFFRIHNRRMECYLNWSFTIYFNQSNLFQGLILKKSIDFILIKYEKPLARFLSEWAGGEWKKGENYFLPFLSAVNANGKRKTVRLGSNETQRPQWPESNSDEEKLHVARETADDRIDRNVRLRKRRKNSTAQPKRFQPSQPEAEDYEIPFLGVQLGLPTSCRSNSTVEEFFFLLNCLPFMLIKNIFVEIVISWCSECQVINSSDPWRNN